MIRANDSTLEERFETPTSYDNLCGRIPVVIDLVILHDHHVTASHMRNKRARW